MVRIAHRFLTLALVTSTVLAALVGGAAAPAHADDEVGLSLDGLTWVGTLLDDLFGSVALWVPGDAETRTFQVRNDGPSEATLSIDVVAADPNQLLDRGDFVLQARVDGGPWQMVAPGVNPVAPSGLVIDEGQRAVVDVQVRFVPQAASGEDELLPLTLRVTLAGDDEVGGVEATDDGNGGGNGEVGGVASDGLPATGSPLDAWMIWLAAALIGAGLALLAPARRRRTVEVSHG